MQDLPKYALWEIERRFLVDPAKLPALDPASERRIEDLYLDGGRLRLRAVTWITTGRREFKLCKKYERDDLLQGPITNLYLTADEHAALADLPGARLEKRRFSLPPFGIDVFDDGLVMGEYEAESRPAALALETPTWATREVTDDPAFSGWSLAQAGLSLD